MVGWTGRIHEHGHTGGGGDQLVQKLEPFRPDLSCQVNHARLGMSGARRSMLGV